MNSIREALKTNNPFREEVLLTLNSSVGKDKIWIFVEGIDDGKLYSKFFDKDRVILRTMDGYNYRISEIVSEISKVTNQVFAIKDADFDRLENKRYSDNIFITDYHDAETMMIACDCVLKNIFNEHLIEKEIEEVRNEALKQTRYIGYIRWFNFKQELEISFKELGINKFYDGVNDFDLPKCIAELNARSRDRKQDLILNEIDNFIKTQIKPIDLLELCNGHDLCCIFAILLSRDSTGKKYSNKDFEKFLRLSYQLSDFKTGQLYDDILTWSIRNDYRAILPA